MMFQRSPIPALVVSVVIGMISLYWSLVNYHNPLFLTGAIEKSGVASSTVLFAGNAVLAALATWIALYLARQVLSELQGTRHPGAAILFVAWRSLLIVAAIGVVVVAVGYGDDFTLADGRPIFGYYALVFAGLLLAMVSTWLRDVPSRSGKPRTANTKRRLMSIAALLIFAYPWLWFTIPMRASASEVRLSEGVLNAARNGQAEIRVADYVDARSEFVCAMTAYHFREDIVKSIGVQYAGPLYDESGTDQIVLVDPDGSGETIYFAAAKIDAQSNEPICARLEKAYLKLDVKRPSKDRLSIVVRLVEK